MAQAALAARASPIGRALKDWRRTRRMSQLDLALAADISARHLSFIETGRARPSRAMVLRLAEALEVPLRERNVLLTAAGFAPTYPERPLADAALSQVRRALDLMLAKHEPYPAIVVNRHWELVMANGGMGRLLGALGAAPASDGPTNLIAATFAPGPLRAAIRNWEEVVRGIIMRLRREIALIGPDARSREMLESLLADPEVAAIWSAAAELDEAPAPVLPVVLEVAGARLSWFTTVATFGTPQDVTLQELMIENFFPADATTEAWAAEAA